MQMPMHEDEHKATEKGPGPLPFISQRHNNDAIVTDEIKSSIKRRKEDHCTRQRC